MLTVAPCFRFPIHCAIEGKSEKLVRWLVDVQFCPIYVLSTGNKDTKLDSAIDAGSDVFKKLNDTLEHKNEECRVSQLPTLRTSKGRSVLSIAMETKHVGILRY